MQIAVLTMSTLSLAASCATLYLMYKTNKSVTGGVEQVKADVEKVKAKSNKGLQAFKDAIKDLEI